MIFVYNESLLSCCFQESHFGFVWVWLWHVLVSVCLSSSYLELVEFPGYLCSYRSSDLERSFIMSLFVLFASPSLPSSGTPLVCLLACWVVSHSYLRLCLLFSTSFLALVTSVILSSRSLILSSAFSDLPLNPFAAKSLQLYPTLQPQRWQPTRLPRPWDSPGKNTGVGCHFLLHWIPLVSFKFQLL